MMIGSNIDSDFDGENIQGVVIQVPRSCIDTQYLASALDKLHELTDTADRVKKYRERVTFVVDGFHEDPRELFEIPEVRKFFCALTLKWPHWLWFMTRGIGQLRLLMMFLCGPQKVTLPGGRVEYGTSPKMMGEVIHDLLVRGHTLFETFNISKEDMRESLNSVMIELGIN